MRVGQALGMQIAKELRFERKHYLYPDLSKQYQTSQFTVPLCRSGRIKIESRRGLRAVRIREAHIEEDAARLGHAGEESYIDFNRAGTPLLEIVTEPDLGVGEDAEEVLRWLQTLLRTIGASDANMEQAQLRCDANVSVAPPGASLGTRVEIKNLNSPRFVRMAIDHEVERQKRLLNGGGSIQQQTRLWNEARARTQAMRSKEEAHDYRYLQEPDLPVLILPAEAVAEIEASVPELPDAKARRLVADYGLQQKTARELVIEPFRARLLDDCCREGADPALTASWLLHQVREIEKARETNLRDLGLKPARLASVLSEVSSEKVSSGNAKKLLLAALDDERPVPELIVDLGLEQISDQETIRTLVDCAVVANPKAIEDLRAGHAGALGFLVGKVLAASHGRANPRLAKSALKRRLGLDRVVVVGMGGAICGRIGVEGAIEAAIVSSLGELVETVARRHDDVAFQVQDVAHDLSENVSPQEWHRLWVHLIGLLEGDSPSAIIVAGGLDSLSYTASLMRWLLPQVTVPIVHTAALRSPDQENSDAIPNLDRAVCRVRSLPPGHWVVVGDLCSPAVNLQMTGLSDTPLACRRMADTDEETAAIANGSWEPVAPSLARLEAAAEQTSIIRIHPCMDTTWLQEAVGYSPRHLILELYDTGTGNARRGSTDSLLDLVVAVRESDRVCLATSQLGVPVDLSCYSTSRELWDAGVVPLRDLITESAFTKLLAAQLRGPDGASLVRLIADAELEL